MSKPKVIITFCEGCRWMLRATWCAQEVLSTFHGQLSGVDLCVGASGEFTVSVHLDGHATLLWDRAAEQGFPEMAELKRRLRDVIAPDQSLGHCEIQTD